MEDFINQQLKEQYKQIWGPRSMYDHGRRAYVETISYEEHELACQRNMELALDLLLNLGPDLTRFVNKHTLPHLGISFSANELSTAADRKGIVCEGMHNNWYTHPELVSYFAPQPSTIRSWSLLSKLLQGPVMKPQMSLRTLIGPGHDETEMAEPGLVRFRYLLNGQDAYPPFSILMVRAGIDMRSGHLNTLLGVYGPDVTITPYYDRINAEWSRTVTRGGFQYFEQWLTSTYWKIPTVYRNPLNNLDYEMYVHSPDRNETQSKDRFMNQYRLGV